MQPMAGAPQIRETPPKRGVPSPLLILSLLLLIPGYKCQPTPHVLSPQETSDPPKSMLTILTHSNTSCSPKGGVRVLPVPPSQSGEVGTTLTLECHYQPPAAIVTWLQVCPRRSGGDSWANSWACSWPREVLPADGGLQVGGGEGLSTLTFRPLRHNHSGLYFCLVRTDTAAAQSCGTFVRVTEPVPEPFLRLGEATKNRILTAQGVLLLLCAVGPGLLLLFRKRWANEQLLQPKKIPCEEENLYEGLNLDECSMYEDISRGVQPTYQDVGTPPAADGLLEKP